MNAADRANVVRQENFYLDLKTGFIMGETPVIKAAAAGNDDRYRGRYVPWTAPIPAGGRVDIQAFQRKVAEDAAKMTASMAAHQAQVVTPQTSEEPTKKAAEGVSSEGGQPKDHNQDLNPAVPTDPERRIAEIAAAIPNLKKADFTAAGLPKVDALSDICKFEIEGHERETAWEAFKKANPDWKPAE